MEAIENIYYSPEDEYADVVLEEIQKGNIDKAKIWEAIRNKEIQPLNGEILRRIIYYMESDILAELIMTMNKKELTFDVLTDCIDYLDEDEADKCLMYYIELGNHLTYSQYTRISYCLSEKMRKKIESEMEF